VNDLTRQPLAEIRRHRFEQDLDLLGQGLHGVIDLADLEVGARLDHRAHAHVRAEEVRLHPAERKAVAAQGMVGRAMAVA
jgi:hypothetical protein